MTIPARTELVYPDRSLWSSYTGRKSGKPLRLVEMGESARAPVDFCAELLELDRAVRARGGALRITSLGRSFAHSDDAHKRYVLGHGPYAKRGGYSIHNGHRSIDADLQALCFPVEADDQLDELWRAAEDAGGYFVPIIASPNEKQDEAWHFDGLGEWRHVYERLGPDQTAVACCLDVGIGGYGQDLARMLQANLHRCGQDVGAIDGDLGRKTRAGLSSLGLSPDITDPRLLFSLPSQRYSDAPAP